MSQYLRVTKLKNTVLIISKRQLIYTTDQCKCNNVNNTIFVIIFFLLKFILFSLFDKHFNEFYHSLYLKLISCKFKYLLKYVVNSLLKVNIKMSKYIFLVCYLIQVTFAGPYFNPIKIVELDTWSAQYGGKYQYYCVQYKSTSSCMRF